MIPLATKGLTLLSTRFGKPLKRAGSLTLSRLRLEVWAGLHTGRFLRVDLSSCVGRSIWLRRHYEPLLENLLRATLGKGDLFVDVGAHLGYFSIIAADLVGSSGQVHSFEPNPHCARLLQMSVHRNGLGNIHLDQRAVWSGSGTQTLFIEKDSAFSHLGSSETARRKQSVRTVSLDSYFSQIRRPAVRLVKIDAEGSEGHILEGMQEILEKDRPIIVAEVQSAWLRRFDNSAETLYRRLLSFGYRARSLLGEPVHREEDLIGVKGRPRFQDLVFEKG